MQSQLWKYSIHNKYPTFFRHDVIVNPLNSLSFHIFLRKGKYSTNMQEVFKWLSILRQHRHFFQLFSHKNEQTRNFFYQLLPIHIYMRRIFSLDNFFSFFLLSATKKSLFIFPWSCDSHKIALYKLLHSLKHLLELTMHEIKFLWCIHLPSALTSHFLSLSCILGLLLHFHHYSLPK